MAARGHHLGLLFQFPACAAPSASLTQLGMGSVCRVGSQVRLCLHISPASSQGGLVKPGWFSPWPFGPLSASHTPAVLPSQLVGPGDFSP